MSLNRYATIFLAVSIIASSLMLSLDPASAQSLKAADKLNDRVVQLHQKGRFDEAIGVAREVLKIRENTLGSNHADVAGALNNLALLYDVQGNYSESELLQKRALAIYEKTLGLNHPSLAGSLLNLASLCYKLGRYSDAEPIYKRSLAIFEKSSGPNHPNVASVINNLAELYRVQGRFHDAEPLFKRALAISEKTFGPNHNSVTAPLTGLAAVYFDQGRFRDAEPLVKRVLAIVEKSLGPNHPNVASAHNNLAMLYAKQGRYPEAELLQRRSLIIFEKALGPNHADVARALNNLAEFIRASGRYSDAEPLFKRSLAIYAKTLGATHPALASPLNNLAELFRADARYSDAELLYTQSLAIFEKSFGSTHPKVAVILNNLGELRVAQGQYPFAEPLFKRSLLVSEEALGLNHPYVATSLNNLAKVYNAESRYSEALPIAQRLIASKEAKRTVTLDILSGSESIKLIGAHRSLSDSYNVLQFSSATRAADAVAKLAQRFAVGSDNLAVLVRQEQDLGTESEWLDAALIAVASKESNDHNAAQKSQFRKRLTDIASERVRIRSILNQKFPDYVALSRPEPLTIEETQQLLAHDEAVVALSIEENNGYAWVVTRTEASWTRIPVKAKDLNAQVAELRQSLTFETRGRQIPSPPFDAVLSYRIYQQTLGPIAARIADKKRLSIVANGALTSLPFGLLVTSDPSRKALKEVDWLIKSQAITVIPSIYSLKTMRLQVGALVAPKPLIAFADPVFSKAAQASAKAEQRGATRSMTSYYQGTQIDIARLRSSLEQLPGTRIEVQSIGRTLGVSPDDMKLGLAATETAVKRARLDQYRVVYFATHGLVAGQVETFAKAIAEPALALTIPDKPTELDDGLLQASEVARLKLNAEWAVLSACNTASADGVGAEALSGLARAFLYAGARSLVVSHWDVADEATQALMSQLFEISSKNRDLSHGEAMQQAMLKLLNDATTEDEAHPRYWAPFIVVGEPRKNARSNL